MKVVSVTYCTQAAYAAQNQQNISAVMQDLQKMPDAGIFYHTCLRPDGKTFIHTAFFKEEANEKRLTGLPSFKHFQEQLIASRPELAPKQELLVLVGSSANLFPFNA